MKNIEFIKEHYGEQIHALNSHNAPKNQDNFSKDLI